LHRNTKKPVAVTEEAKGRSKNPLRNGVKKNGKPKMNTKKDPRQKLKPRHTKNQSNEYR